MSDDVIQPTLSSIYKSLRLRKFKNGGNYTTGLRITDNDKVNVGLVFPFESSTNNIVDGIQTIFGYKYGERVTFYWMPRRFRIKDNIFTRKFFKYDENIPRVINSDLPSLRTKKTVFVRTGRKNYIYDYGKVLENVFPKFDNHAVWGDNRFIKHFEEFFYDWFNFILNDPKCKSEIFTTDLFTVGEGVRKTHGKIVMGIKMSSSNSNLVKYIDPSVQIPRAVKNLMDEMIPIFIIRCIIAGVIGYKEDPILVKIYDLIKDTSIVFYNNNGNGFIFNSNNDKDIQRMKGVSILARLRDLCKITLRNNTETLEAIGVTDDMIDDTVETIENSVIDTQKPILNKKDDVLDGAVDMMLNSDKVAKLAQQKAEGLMASKAVKNDGDEDINDVFIDEEESSDAEIVDDIDDVNDIPDDIPIEEEEIDEGMLSDDGVGDGNDDSGGTVQDGTETGSKDEDVDSDIRNLLATVSRSNKPKLTPAQIRRRQAIRDKYKSLKIGEKTIEEIILDNKVTSIDTSMPDVKVRDNSVKGSRLMDMERSYIEKTMEHDIVNVMKSLSENKSIAMHITDVEKHDTSDQLTNKYTYVFKFVDDNDKRHTVRVDIPKLDEDGFLLVGGNKKILKKQLTLLPVIKCKPDLVMISSNYNKCFIYRQGNVITRNVSYLQKLLNKYLVNNPRFKVFFGDNSKENTSVITNIEYDVLAAKYHRFIVGVSKLHNSEYIFNQKELRKLIKDNNLTYKFDVNRLPVGIDWKERRVIDVDLRDSADSVCDKIFEDIRMYQVMKNLDEVLKTMNIAKRRMFTKIELQSRDYALISFLGALYGLSKVINTDKIKVEFAEKRLQNDERVYVRFKDGYLYYNDTNTSASLLLNGLAYMNCEDYEFADFDTEKPYIDYFYEIAHSRNVYKGHTAFKELFIDKITEEILIDLKLPTDFLELFLYANSLLSDNTYTPETSLENYRIRGFENVSVILYKAISAQYRLYKQSNTGTGRISIQQDQVMVGLHKSFILENYDSTNPVNELKSKSIVTFKGPGGINNDRVFTLEKRAYDRSAIGTIAISSVDNGSVGITKQLTTNPNVLSTRGYIDICRSKEEAKKLRLGDIASPEEANIAFVNSNDDPKRIGFTSGQTKHIIKVKKASLQVVSTGMDKCTPYMVGNSYVPKARNNGVCKRIDEANKIMIVEYADGSSESIGIGESVQRNSSFYFPNNIVPNVKEGQKFKKGDILGYEAQFYKKDVFGSIRGVDGVLAKLVLHEKSVTDDDSSNITERFSRKLYTEVVKRKQIVLTKDTNIVSFKKRGDHVLKGDPILVFEDSGDEDVNKLMGDLGEMSEDVMAMARQTPKANATGEIIDIKVYYTVPLETMSDSVHKFVMDWFKDLKARNKVEKASGIDNIKTTMQLKQTEPLQAGADKRINGCIIPDEGGIVIEYYIKHEQGMGVGDKLTLSSCIKSVVAQVVPEGKEPVTDDGIILDGTMGAFSNMARMVYSTLMIGTLSHVMVEKSKEIARKFLDS